MCVYIYTHWYPTHLLFISHDCIYLSAGSDNNYNNFSLQQKIDLKTLKYTSEMKSFNALQLYPVYYILS